MLFKAKVPDVGSPARKKINKRVYVLYIVIVALFSLLIARLFWMQVVKGDEYSDESQSNIYRTITLPARRGTIYDTNGNVLASSEPYMNIQVYPSEIEDKDKDAQKKKIEELSENLAELFSRDDIIAAEEEAREVIAQSTISEDVEKVNKEIDQKKRDEEREARELAEEQGITYDDDDSSASDGDLKTEEEEDINAASGSLTENKRISATEIENLITEGMDSYQAISIRTYTYDVGVMIAEIVAENPDDYPGVYVSEEPMRSYPYGYYLGHVLGTVGNITQDQLEEMSSYGYDINDIVGQSGLESYYEYYTEGGKVYSLSGEDGKRVVEVNAKSTILSVISEESPVAGNSLKLTIDLNTQEHMEDSLKNVISDIHESNSKCKAGSAVLLDTNTGGVIAMASYPSIDPNDFARGLSDDEVSYYFSDDYSPQVNRAISSGYASGSTFKMVTATAILSEGISPNDTIICSEASRVDPLAKCHDHGAVNFYDAVKMSCNIYFQKMAGKIGEDALIEMGLKYGFGQKTGIDLSGEKSGLLPTPEWKSQNYTGWESTWHDYDTYYMSMGQGATVDTVIQLACMASTIANHGERLKPYIVQSILDDEGNVLKTTEPEVVETIDLAESDWQTIIEAMEGVVGDDGGTASNLFASLPSSLLPAGKTGTAQTGLASDDSENDYHGVFIAFAPADDPQVAFAGLVEYGGGGASSAAYVCRDTFRAYFGYDVDYDILLMDNLYSETHGDKDIYSNDEEDDEEDDEE